MRPARTAANLIAALLALVAPLTGATAYEVEEERRFGTPEADRELHILSTTDTEHFQPLIEAFLATRPNVALIYTVASSTETYKAVAEEAAPVDLVISSAMDLQMKLANDGLALPHRSDATLSLPDWARWRDHLFAFAQEPAVTLLSRRVLDQLPAPQTRQELIALLRDNPALFRGRIGTYDPRSSGTGYLFATQDARQSQAYWRLVQVMGGLQPRIYCCSGQMIADLKAGDLMMAYNVTGSYAAAQLDPDREGLVIALQDYTNVLLRSVLIPPTARDPDLGRAFIDYLLSPAGRALQAERTGLPPIDGAALGQAPHLHPIALGPGLLVYLDQIKRQNFLREWTDAMIQP
ncbi:ABC transporter substrate-binding protein [Oceanomicrobium pacificus]|uniref:Extracellular solute-binding protein n=1 Tax=Oceanomicrobium pacificus TaxID=2692916 RepID=A0A6B0TPP1_9RHOB|nr:ABC transporter substrate-binding protein [Oceanomicrobium pacificus]MXU66630.1 extracellular solute-binding protein [Oceanomicrobium pacificus]